MKRLTVKITAWIAAMMIPITNVHAERMISLSEWAYNDVSSFVSAGLLPESFDRLTDYTQSITRLQFCELVESIVQKTKSVFDDFGFRLFEDTEIGSAADYLADFDIVNGVEGNYFYPDNNISRQEAATIIYRTGMKFGSSIWYTTKESDELYSDDDKIAEYADTAVYTLKEIGIVTDTKDNIFDPTGDVTIEQAVVMAFRLYNTFSKIVVSDLETADISSEPCVLKKFDCGLDEIYKDNSLIIAENGKELLRLERDVYSIVNCGQYNGTRLVFAVNFNDRTDVYNADSGELLYEIPYITQIEGAPEGYIYTISSRWHPAYYGIYSMDGSEILPAQYNKTEISLMAKNGFSMPTEEYREADGWIYYSDESDGGKMYRVDTNGENKQKLSESNCGYIRYYFGKIVYKTLDDGLWHIMNTDGTENKDLTGFNDIEIMYNKMTVLMPIIRDDNMIYIESSLETDGGEPSGRYIYWSNINNDIYYTDTQAEDPVIEQICNDSVFRRNYGDSLYYVKDGSLYKLTGNEEEFLIDGYDIVAYGYAPAGNDDGFDRTKLWFVEKREYDKSATIFEYDIETGKISEFEMTCSEVGSIKKTLGKNNSKNTTEEILGRYLEDEIVMKNSVIYSERVKISNDGYNVSYGIAYLKRYDKTTGEETVLTDTYRNSVISAKDNSWIIYSDWNDVWYRYSEENGIEQVFPGKGIYKYGELEYIMRPDKISGCLYKVDTEGNCSRIAEQNYNYEIYVSNDGSRFEMFYDPQNYMKNSDI